MSEQDRQLHEALELGLLGPSDIRSQTLQVLTLRAACAVAKKTHKDELSPHATQILDPPLEGIAA